MIDIAGESPDLGLTECLVDIEATKEGECTK